MEDRPCTRSSPGTCHRARRVCCRGSRRRRRSARPGGCPPSGRIEPPPTTPPCRTAGPPAPLRRWKRRSGSAARLGPACSRRCCRTASGCSPESRDVQPPPGPELLRRRIGRRGVDNVDLVPAADDQLRGLGESDACAEYETKKYGDSSTGHGSSAHERLSKYITKSGTRRLSSRSGNCANPSGEGIGSRMPSSRKPASRKQLI